MGKLLVAVVALAMLGYFGYQALYKTKFEALEDRVAHAPKRQLDNVREKAKEFEVKTEENFKEVERKTTGE